MSAWLWVTIGVLAFIGIDTLIVKALNRITDEEFDECDDIDNMDWKWPER